MWSPSSPRGGAGVVWPAGGSGSPCLHDQVPLDGSLQARASQPGTGSHPVGSAAQVGLETTGTWDKPSRPSVTRLQAYPVSTLVVVFCLVYYQYTVIIFKV
ncbi:hypothetical protein ElyMa_005481700 [Elysia marginata]|uniref:Uncharacterized protein n=1 Tax=Elysia marginata TaxID=1093978 RepID=A0AAV4EQQ2_9GAST|nr:hypothetical protein ElyMa_005481700 [Elysia marginata]